MIMEKISDWTETKKGLYFILGLSAIIKVLVLILEIKGKVFI